MLSSRAIEWTCFKKIETHTDSRKFRPNEQKCSLQCRHFQVFEQHFQKAQKTPPFANSQKTLQMLDPIDTFYHRYSCTDFLMYRNLQFETKFSLCQMYFKNRTNFTFSREDLKFLTLISHTSRQMGCTGWWWYCTLESHAWITKKTSDAEPQLYLLS